MRRNIFRQQFSGMVRCGAAVSFATLENAGVVHGEAWFDAKFQVTLRDLDIKLWQNHRSIFILSADRLSIRQHEDIFPFFRTGRFTAPGRTEIG